MKEKIYLYTEINNKGLIQELFFDCDVTILEKENLTDTNFTNKNVLFFANKSIKEITETNFFIKNNVIFFSLSKNAHEESEKLGQTKFINKPIKIKKLYDIVKTCFYSKILFYEDIKIIDETIINVKNNLFSKITLLEKTILSELVEKKEIRRDYFLENIIKIKKDAETKTVESHLTRIRKKILSIKSKIQISLKEDVIYIGLSLSKD